MKTTNTINEGLAVAARQPTHIFFIHKTSGNKRTKSTDRRHPVPSSLASHMTLKFGGKKKKTSLFLSLSFAQLDDRKQE